MQVKERIFNRSLLYHRLKKIAHNFSRYDFLHKFAAEKIIENIEITNPKLDNVLIFGQRTIDIAEHIKNKNPNSNIIVSSMNSEMLPDLDYVSKLVVDEENLPFSCKFDLVISSLSMQFINDIPKYLVNVKNMLNEGGFFLANFFGEESLMSLRNSFAKIEMELYGKAYMRIVPFITREDTSALIKRAGYKDNIVGMDKCGVSYKDIRSLLRDLQNAGLSNIMHVASDNKIGKDLLHAVEEYYSDNYDMEAEFDIVNIIGS